MRQTNLLYYSPAKRMLAFFEVSDPVEPPIVIRYGGADFRLVPHVSMDEWTNEIQPVVKVS